MPGSNLMNELTIVGNITADPILRRPGNGRGVIRFDLAVNRQRFNRETNQYEDLPPVFHRVVAFGPVAENAAISVLSATRRGLLCPAVESLITNIPIPVRPLEVSTGIVRDGSLRAYKVVGRGAGEVVTAGVAAAPFSLP